MLTFREDDAIRDAYMRDVVWGSFFYKYAGLWMLATDVLPNQFEQEIHLFVYRDCSCAMEAWVCLLFGAFPNGILHNITLISRLSIHCSSRSQRT